MPLEKFTNEILSRPWAEPYGRISKVRRDSVRVFVPDAKVGALFETRTHHGIVTMEVVSLDPDGHVAMPLDDLGEIRLGDPVFLKQSIASIPVGPEILGRVVDSLVQPYQSDKPLRLMERISLYHSSLNPMERTPISEPLDLGVRAINSCLTAGKGQRIGIYAGSGVGKSVLLGMMSRFTSADVVVIGLIGERGREVREFIEDDLGEQGLKKSVVVVETADKSAVRRVRGAYVATAMAEYFKNQGANVLLLVDSLTRFAMAQREIGMAAGEPPTTKGYTPSVFGNISKIAERAGNWGKQGSVTGLYTVLVEGDDMEDPIADSTRAILDGHIVLSRRIANRGQYPAIDVLSSVSRTMDRVVSKDQIARSRKLKSLIARYQENEDFILAGAYQRGSDLETDQAIEKQPEIRAFLQQRRDEQCNFFDSKNQLEALMG